MVTIRFNIAERRKVRSTVSFVESHPFKNGKVQRTVILNLGMLFWGKIFRCSAPLLIMAKSRYYKYYAALPLDIQTIKTINLFGEKVMVQRTQNLCRKDAPSENSGAAHRKLCSEDALKTVRCGAPEYLKRNSRY